MKVQLYSSKKLFNNNREYLEFKKDEFLRVADYAKNNIKLFASIFDEERLKWCEEAGVEIYK